MTRRARWAPVGIVWLWAVLLNAACNASPAIGQPVVGLAQSRYDIPAQPLGDALARFAQLSHVDILYDETLMTARSSSAIHATLTPQQALQALLEGTSLSFRFTRSNAAIVYDRGVSAPAFTARDASSVPGATLTLETLQVRAMPMIGGGESFQGYGQRLIGAIDAELRPQARAYGANYQAVMRIWIANDGAVDNVDFPIGTGDPALDRVMINRVSALKFDMPPRGLPQPVRIQLESR